jgi:hypothetical protein
MTTPGKRQLFASKRLALLYASTLSDKPLTIKMRDIKTRETATAGFFRALLFEITLALSTAKLRATAVCER